MVKLWKSEGMKVCRRSSRQKMHKYLMKNAMLPFRSMLLEEYKIFNDLIAY